MNAVALLRRYWPEIVTTLVMLGLSAAFLLTRATLADTKTALANERAAHALTVANFRTASAKAQADAAANARRVLTEQQQITKEVSDDYQAQLADVRARADALRVRLAQAGAASGGAGAGGASAVPHAAGGPDGAAAQNGLPAEGWALEDRVIATEQALQLAALQRWVREQAAVDFNRAAP